MSNMSYCRFENTLNDLRDCVQHWSDDQDDPDEDGYVPKLSRSEDRARKRLLELCCEIAEVFGGMEYGDEEVDHG